MVDDIYRALAADKKHLTGLASKLTDITEVPQENDKKLILKDLSTKKIKNFFIQTIFKKDTFLEFVADLVKSKDDDKKTVKYVWQDILDKIAHLKIETIKK